jgi:hypothetical protein
MKSSHIYTKEYSENNTKSYFIELENYIYICIFLPKETTLGYLKYKFAGQ